MAELSISRAWDEAKARIAADGRLFTIVAAATLLVPQALVTVLAPPAQLSGEEPGNIASLLTLLAALIGIIGQIALIHLALVPGASVGEALNRGVRRFLPVFVAAVLLGIALFLICIPLVLLFGGAADLERLQAGALPPSVALAVLLLVVISIFLGVKFLMTMPVGTAEPGGPIHILKRSWSLTNGHYWRLLGFMLLIVIAAVVIVLAVQAVVGTLIAAVFGDTKPLSAGALIYALVFGAMQALFGAVLSIMLARIYVQLSGRQSEAEASVPKTGA